MSTKQQRIGESKVAEDTDGTIPLLQQIVGEDYEVMASEEVEQHIMDRCINLVEAAGFRATMKTLALGLKEAVKKGKNIGTTYQDLVKSMIEVARAMRCLGAFSVEVEDILAAIPDIHCNAWRKHLKGDSAMRPLVILHIPKTEELCAKLREAAETKTRKTAVRASRVVEVMETTNLPQLQKEWMVEDAHKAKKMIACLVYKYDRDVMFKETTAVHVIVDKFKVKQTTTHRQLYGKKYPGGG